MTMVSTNWKPSWCRFGWPTRSRFCPFGLPSHGTTGEIQLDVRTCWPVRSRSEMAPIPTGSDNLVVRALELLRERSGCEFGARVELAKRIPAAAGLGGGSSDAAAALRLANRGWKIHWSNDRLTEVAAEIGSDVPFFLEQGAAICRGRGERVERLPPIAPLHFVMVKPPVGLDTGEVYRTHAATTDWQGRRHRFASSAHRTTEPANERPGARSRPVDAESPAESREFAVALGR